MLPDLSDDVRWRKASASGGEGGECVEIAHTMSAVRDSKNPEGPRLRVPLGDLLQAVKAGRLAS